MLSQKHFIRCTPCEKCASSLFYKSVGKCVARIAEDSSRRKQRKKEARFKLALSKPFTGGLDGEVWKEVAGFEGQYAVSNLGRVRTLPHLVPYKRGTTKFVPPRILRPGAVKSGHLTVCLRRGRSVAVHRIVLETFVGPCPDGMECCHGDGLPFNNELTNLRWDTRSANLFDAVRHGAKRIGQNCAGARLKNSDIPVIRRLLAQQVSIRKVAALFDVSSGAINNIKYDLAWKHIVEHAA